MSSPTLTRRAAVSRARVAGAAFVAVMALTLPTSALAQDAGSDRDVVFPVMLGEEPLAAETFTGQEWLDRLSEGGEADRAYVEETEALVERLGKSLDDLTVKTALYQPTPGTSAVVAAFRVDGVEAREFAEDAIGLLVGDIPSPDLVLRPFGEKWTLRIQSEEMPGVYPRTAYLKDDTIWIIEGDEGYVFDALDQLPEPDPIGALPGDDLVTELPYTLGERRRIGLYESLEPLFLPTFSERLGPEIDEWLVDLYLDAGISPSAILGAVAWWGLESTQDSIEIEAYRLPAGTDDLVERLRSRIFLGEGEDAPSFGGLLDGVERTEEEIGGRTVTTLDFGFSRQHIFSSGDTVWVVTDHAGEPELAEAAIAAIP